MATKIEKHICNDLYHDNISIMVNIIKGDYKGSRWWLETVPLKLTIKYCPWCGEKLE